MLSIDGDKKPGNIINNGFIVINLKNCHFHRWNYMFFAKKSQADFAANNCNRKRFFGNQLSPGMLLQFFQKLLVFPNICIYMHIFKPRTRLNEVVNLNSDLNRACILSTFFGTFRYAASTKEVHNLNQRESVKLKERY